MTYRTILSTLAGAVLCGALATSANAADYNVVDDTIPTSLTGKAGDPVAGKKIAINRKKGNCLACHVMPIPEEQFHGEIGPDLSDVGSTYSVAEIRIRLVNSKIFNSDTIMPAFLKPAETRVLKKFKGKSILKPQEIEDVVAYLMTLKGQYSQ
jgi:sulfur-oxidizing protein SoxX